MIDIIEDFTGYPDGKTPRDFCAGETDVDVPAEFAELAIAKGHAVKSAKKKKDAAS